jgi:choloylglycine hydrolase
MNEAGLVVSTMSLPATTNPPPDNRPPLTSGFWLQYQLDTASSVEEVIGSDTVVRIADTVDHYLVADRQGECAVIEFINGELVVHRGDSLPVKALTNDTYEESLRYWNRCVVAKAFSRLTGSPGPSFGRFDIAASKADSFSHTGQEGAVSYAFEVLSTVRGEEVGGAPTQWSIVFTMKDLKVCFHTRQNPTTRCISLGGLDFSCQTPAQMMSVHSGPSGEATAALGEYSHEVSLNHFLRFFQQWGVAIGAERTKELVGFFEGFKCIE